MQPAAIELESSDPSWLTFNEIQSGFIRSINARDTKSHSTKCLASRNSEGIRIVRTLWNTKSMKLRIVRHSLGLVHYCQDQT